MRIHRRIPELLGIHLAKTLVALRVDRVLVSVSILLNKIKPLPFTVAILLSLSLLAEVEWRCGNIDITIFDERTHVSKKEGENQRIDMTAIHVGVSHQYNLVVSQFFDVQLLGVILRSNANAQCSVDVLDLLALQHLVWHRFLHVENLSAKGKDRLEHAVTALLGGTTGRVTLHEEQLAQDRIFA